MVCIVEAEHQRCSVSIGKVGSISLTLKPIDVETGVQENSVAEECSCVKGLGHIHQEYFKENLREQGQKR